MPNLSAVRKESMRVGYLSLDAAGRTGADNPMTKLKVRQAVWHAIDRQAIADKLVTGGSRVPPAPCFPPQFGCDGEIAVLYDYNPAKAKQLLAEAGYPNGFDVELATYVLPQWGAAVQNYLQAVGIRAKLNQLQVQALVQRTNAGELRMYLGSWGSYSINDVSAIMPNFFDGGVDGLCARSGRDQMADRGRHRRTTRRCARRHTRPRSSASPSVPTGRRCTPT